jgi:hypothetical protein
MATEINRAPVLTGKAAKEFWRSVENFKDDNPVHTRNKRRDVAFS